VLSGTVLERTAANLIVERLVDSVRRRPEETTLVDRGWHAWMFEERERHALESLARRMRAAGRAGGDSFEAFNALGDHVAFVARAHLERVTLEAFIAGIAACDDPDARPVLERLCSLYALGSIGADRGWFQEHNRLSSGRAKAIGAQVNALCRELRPHALGLVEGLGMPEAWLGAAFLRD
jgi:acyl-CoA oxidase